MSLKFSPVSIGYMSHVDFKPHIPPCVICVLHRQLSLKPLTDVTSNLLAIDFQLDIQIACNGLQQKFQHAEYFTLIFTKFSPLSSEFHDLSIDSSYIFRQ